MTRSQSCSWCHVINELHAGCAVYCSSCGHRADLPRVHCDCPACVGSPREDALKRQLLKRKLDKEAQTQ